MWPRLLIKFYHYFQFLYLLHVVDVSKWTKMAESQFYNPLSINNFDFRVHFYTFIIILKQIELQILLGESLLDNPSRLGRVKETDIPTGVYAPFLQPTQLRDLTIECNILSNEWETTSFFYKTLKFKKAFGCF